MSIDEANSAGVEGTRVNESTYFRGIGYFDLQKKFHEMQFRAALRERPECDLRDYERMR